METSHFDIIIVGAGASGLSAGREFAKAGKKVCILEGRNRTGGRIHTVHDPSFEKPVEAGAEFIHGHCPLTISLLNEYRIDYHPVKGSFWRARKNGDMNHSDDFIDEHQHLLAKHLKELKEDISVEKFLEINFDEEKYSSLKNSIRKFVEGYDVADPSRASTYAFREEWLNEEDEQYRIAGGYGRLISALENECFNKGCIIKTSARAKIIYWKPYDVKILLHDGSDVTAAKVIITAPPGVLASTSDHVNSINFSPAIPDTIKALEGIGYGGVIKIALQFNNEFWKEDEIQKRVGENFKKLSFVFSDELIPTWWTQFPDSLPMLTGWLGGSAAARHAFTEEEIILKEALKSLSSIFQLPPDDLSLRLIASHIYNWVLDPYSAGAYSYAMVDSPLQKKILNQPIQETIYFSGEALSLSGNSGTVEAALNSGFYVAKRILSPEN